MRRQNCSFNTAFVSEAGGKLFNNDYFAFVELDDFACYVMADGIEEKSKSKAAKEAVQACLTEFSQRPSMSKNRLKRLLKRVNHELRTARSKKKLESSLVLVVTDYIKFRYVSAGNTRMSLYREGQKLLQSKDQSYTIQLEESGKINKDKVMRHIERNNLRVYLGQEKGFKPFISKKMKLKNLDVINLYTRGVWENVDDGELDDIIGEIKDSPEELVNTVEDFLLSRQPDTLENYSFFTLFVDKVFYDPNKEKKRKKIIIICLVILLIALVIGFFIYKWKKDKQEKIEEMNRSYGDVIEYLQDSNFVRAEEACKKTLPLAIDLKHQEVIQDTGNYQKLSESIILADTAFYDGDYKKAQLNYIEAKERSLYADGLGLSYAEEQLERVGHFIAVYDSIYLGDQLVSALDFEGAKAEYMYAKNLSTQIYFDKGREDAIKALESLYALLKENNEATQELVAAKLVEENIAAEMLRKGEAAFAEEDYSGALVFYEVAKEKYSDLDELQRVEFVDRKIEQVTERMRLLQEKIDKARMLMETGDEALSKEDYSKAKKNYLLSEDLYIKLDFKEKIEILQKRLSLVEDLITLSTKENDIDTE